jgi:hypothetical protein
VALCCQIDTVSCRRIDAHAAQIGVMLAQTDVNAGRIDVTRVQNGVIAPD